MSNMPQTTLRVLVAERHPVFCAGIVATIDAADTMTVVGECSSLAGLMESVGLIRPDVAIVDAGMIDRQTYTRLEVVCRPLGVRILVVAPPWSGPFASLVADEVIGNCISRGSTPAQLVEALGLLREGKRAVCRLMVTDVGGPQPTALTTTELSVLALAAEGLSNAAIAAKLRVSLAGVNAHVRRLRVKLGARDRTHAVTLALRYGLLEIDAS